MHKVTVIVAQRGQEPKSNIKKNDLKKNEKLCKTSLPAYDMLWQVVMFFANSKYLNAFFLSAQS